MSGDPRWHVDRVVGLLAGTFILVSLGLARVHHRRWRLMTAFIGGNLILQAVAGWCPASLALRRLGVPDARARSEAPATTKTSRSPARAPDHATFV
jgi:hypothetical protein